MRSRDPWRAVRALTCAHSALAVMLVVASVVAPARAQSPAAEAELAAELDARALTDDRFVATTVYSWTTEAQAAELARTRRLLSRGADDGVSRSPYQQALDAVATDASASSDDATLARLLTGSPELGARRYAWVTPYGTAIPRGQRSYGPVLLSITLSDDALFARFAPSERPAFRVVDVRGSPVSAAAVIAAPSRLGSVVHVRADDPRGPYREIIVHGSIAPDAVSCWSMGTATVSARIDADRAIVSRLRRIARPRRPLPLAPFWLTRSPADDVRRWTARWARTMPFDTSRHRLTPTVLSELERVLASRLHQRATPIDTCPSR